MGDEEMTFTVAETAPELRRGDHGSWVGYLQQLLAAEDRRMTRLDFDIGTIDDDFGPRTERAVKAYQAFMQVEVTGVVDYAVWNTLITSAETFERFDDAKAEDVDAGRAGEEIADPEAVGRRGWRRVTFDCGVKSFRGRPFPAGTALIRFVDEHDTATDSWEVMHDGRIHVEDLWVPEQGHFYLYVDSFQPGPDGRLGSVGGFERYECGSSDRLHFEAVQQPGDQGTVSFEEAESHGWTQGGEFQVGLDLEVLTIGSSVSGDSTEEHTRSEGRSITVIFPGEGFVIERQ